MNTEELLLREFEEGAIPYSYLVRPECFESNYPERFLISRLDFEQLKSDYPEEVQGMVYEEYCMTEHECWSDMLKVLCAPEWIKPVH